MELLVSAGTFFFLKKGIKYSDTAYALQAGGCKARCAFCTQSSVSRADKAYLSRVKWYPVKLEDVKDKLSSFKRFCLQTVLKDGFEEEALNILRQVNIRKSVTIAPVDERYLWEMKEVGVDYLGVGMDTTRGNWEKVGKPYSFERYLEFVKRAVEVFGRGKVYVHLVFGLGEDKGEFVELMKELFSLGAEVALFAFTPVKGTPMEDHPRPSLEEYREVQRIRFALSTGATPNEKAYFTSGCPSCDRPFYNEDPREKPYNVPLMEARRL
ncbi:MAG: radical SAM protein [Candidatus Aramenus sp.]|jgi:biotin synthase|nr:radical SAM protein [Candidatus Aramenus sp.]